ncbi:MAG: phosphoribosylamine--glycine ligase [Bacteroidia bacterium]|nr:phosphoribosylamine--glycine ligase [Bacteroidia bacterium]
MNILLLGSGGREHALAWKIAGSKKINNLFIAPGNGGTSNCGSNLPVNPEDFDAVKKISLEHNITLLVVGPEAPLVMGIHDFFLNDPQVKHINVIGPTQAGARLEGSKDFAKQFMQRHSIPTAHYKIFTKESINEAFRFFNELAPPYVLKADGLAAGKGVLIINDLQEAKANLSEMFEGKFGEAGLKVVLEQYLKGIEISVFIITDGIHYKILPEAKDYKRIGEGDTGPNTGGMGAISPVPFADKNFMEKVEQRIIVPTVKGLLEDGIPYKGFIFFGLMNVDGYPYVIEYNVRMGDPESESVIPRIKSDIVDFFEGVANQTLNEKELEIDKRTVATVILASKGYPGDYQKRKVIENLCMVDDSLIFHAGTKLEGDTIISNGGRVLAVSSFGSNINEAINKSNKNAGIINFEGKYFRKDIGFDLNI